MDRREQEIQELLSLWRGMTAVQKKEALSFILGQLESETSAARSCELQEKASTKP